MSTAGYSTPNFPTSTLSTVALIETFLNYIAIHVGEYSFFQFFNYYFAVCYCNMGGYVPDSRNILLALIAQLRHWQVLCEPNAAQKSWLGLTWVIPYVVRARHGSKVQRNGRFGHCLVNMWLSSGNKIILQSTPLAKKGQWNLGYLFR